jgi:phage terminase small subunit
MPSRLPTRLKVIRGTAAHDPGRLNKAEPQPALGEPIPPPWLGKSGAAHDAWSRLAPRLAELGIVTSVDGEGLGLLCDAIAEYSAAKRSGGWRRLDAAGRRLKILLGEFGLTPASRGRVTAVLPEAADPTEAWVRQGEAAKPTRPGGPK